MVMNKEKKSLLQQFNPYHFKFGSKLFLITFLLITLCLVVTSVIGIRYFKNYIEESNYTRLSQISETKQKYLEDKFRVFQKEFIEFTESDVVEYANDLKNAYINYDIYEYSDKLDNVKTALEGYYHDDILNLIHTDKPDLTDVFPVNNKQLVLQYEFLYNNPFSVDEKDKFLESKTRSEYSDKHKVLHTKVKSFTRKHSISNLYLIDGRHGDIFYNLNKNIALGSNLFEGPYKNSELATIFQRSLARSKKTTVVSDYSFFIPNYNKAVGYIAYPIYLNGEKKIIAVAELDPEFFQQYLFDSWMHSDKESVSLSLIGEDHLLRTNDIEMVRHPDAFLSYLSHKGRKNRNFRIASETESCALNLGFDKELNLESSNQVTGDNYLKHKAFIYSQELHLDGLNWSLVANAEVAKSFLYLRNVKIAILIAIFVLIVFSMFIVSLVKNSITRRLTALSNSIKIVTKGEQQSETFESPWKDELGETIHDFDILKDRVSLASKFAFELSEGVYTTEFKSESENDGFAHALNTLKEKLKSNKEISEKREIDDKIRTWTNDGIAKFNDLLRQSNDNIKQLSYIIIEHLIEYLGANQGGIFLVEGEDDEAKSIQLAASFAYDRKKYNTKVIEIGEGLIGNCYLEKKPIHLKKIPQDYIEVTSGLGKTNPSVLYIVPLMVDNNVLGFIELASLEDIEEYKIDFINRLADNIAATFSTVKLNTRTAELLEESKRRAHEIAQQEEEMRQNMEEMQATQEELSRIRDEDEKRSKAQEHELKASYKMIQQLLNSFDGEVLLKDAQGVIVLANEEAATRFNSTPEKLKGKTDDDLFAPEKAQREYNIDQQVLIDGFYSEESIELVGSMDVKYFIVKKQFFLPNRQETGILTIRNKRQ